MDPNVKPPHPDDARDAFEAERPTGDDGEAADAPSEDSPSGAKYINPFDLPR
jgi:hypothetical protein